VKRFIGWLLTFAGGGAAIWGGVLLLTGSSDTRLHITPDFSPSALMVGLAGAAVLTVGLVWVRD
jgi:hypothetical protein